MENDTARQGRCLVIENVVTVVLLAAMDNDVKQSNKIYTVNVHTHSLIALVKNIMIVACTISFLI